MSSQIVLPEWEQLKQVALDWEEGKTVSHEELAEIMLLKPSSQKYYNSMQKAIKSLTSIGIRLANVKGVGYKVLTADEWLIEAKRMARKGGKSITEAQDIVNHAPLLRMSENVRQECMQLHDMLIKQKYLLAGGVISVQTLDNRKKIQAREGNVL